MFRWYVRYLPYALVVWLCRRHSERFIVGSLHVANPFKGEFVGWPRPTPAGDRDG